MNIKELAIALGQSGGVLFTKTELEECVALVEAQTRARCIELVLAGSSMPIQTRTLEALQRDRKRIAKLIAGDSIDLRALVDSYTMASEENKI